MAMKILHTIPYFTPTGGGTSTCTYDLLRALHEVEPQTTVDLLCPASLRKDDPLMGNDDWIKPQTPDGISPIGYSRNLRRFIARGDYDLYHTNGMWMDVNHATCALARKMRKPYIITPHGMLYPEAMSISRWKKWPLMKLWYNRDIRHAAAIHVTCTQEMEHIRALGYRGPVAVIGNPVAVPDYTAMLITNRTYTPLISLPPASAPREAGLFWGVAFLGRLHPRKKIENFLYGVALSGADDVQAHIIGSGDEAYGQFLRAEAARLGIADRVIFHGFLKGREKFETLARMRALFVPSDMENFGMIVPEALLVGTPVYASTGTPWEALRTHSCGWWDDNDPATIARIINELRALSPAQLQAMGQRGRKYILDTFSAPQVAAQMLTLYRWILAPQDGAPKPSFIYD